MKHRNNFGMVETVLVSHADTDSYRYDSAS